MGCGNPKEKIEDEIMKAKLERIALHMERMKQIKVLENIEGHPIKCPIIPDYIADDFILNKNKKQNEKNNDPSNNLNINNSRIKSKRCKSSIGKKIDLNENTELAKKRKINKKKTSKY